MIKKIKRYWRRIPRSFKRQVVLIALGTVIAVTILVLMYPRAKGVEEEAAEMATLMAEIYQNGGNHVETRYMMYDVGNRTRIVHIGWAWENTSVEVGNYDVVIDIFGHEQEFFSVEILPGENKIRFDLPAAELTISTLYESSPVTTNVEIFTSLDRIYPVAVCNSNERLILPPGEYDVRMMWGGNEEWLEGLILRDGDNRLETHNFRRSAL